MNRERKIIGLRVAIILASALLIVLIVGGIKSGRERALAPPEVRTEGRTPELQPIFPEIKELEEIEFQFQEVGEERFEEEREEVPQVRIEEIPFEKILQEKIAKEEVVEVVVTEEEEEEEEEALPKERRTLEISPSPEELKGMKERGAVIY